MAPSFLSFRRDSTRKKSRTEQSQNTHRYVIPWIASPIDEGTDAPQLRKRSDSSPIELFYDLFLVGNLATFSATHEINTLTSLWAYIGFLGVIWFTWLQVTLYDIRFARDSVYERTCKAAQLAAMVGFASAGSRFSTHIRGENFWAFRSLSVLLGGSRYMLAIQYAINARFMREKMKSSMKGMYMNIAILGASGTAYLMLYASFGQTSVHIWVVWFGFFLAESVAVMQVASRTPGLGLEDTHLHVRMGLLTLIIIGEGVISVTRIVNKMVAPGGWTMWSFVHTLGVSTTVYLLWQSYHDISPTGRIGKIRQQIWAHLHFPFHAALVLSAEGSQILTLTLDVALKLRYLGETIIFACEEPRPTREYAVNLLTSTILDMEINFAKGGLKENVSINFMLDSLWHSSTLCPDNSTNGTTNSTGAGLTPGLVTNLMGNVTVALFSSMGITPTQGNLSRFTSRKLLMMYVGLLGFVYMYYFISVALAMMHFSAFAFLTRRHPHPLHNAIAVGIRLGFGLLLLGLVAFAQNFNLTYFFMTSPMITFVFALALFAVLIVDRLLDWLRARKKGSLFRRGSNASPLPMVRMGAEAGTASFEDPDDERLAGRLPERNPEGPVERNVNFHMDRNVDQSMDRDFDPNLRVYRNLRVDRSVHMDRSLHVE